MDHTDRAFLQAFFRQLLDQPLAPDDPRYVPIYSNRPSEDPVELLARGIEWTPGGSVQLLSGFRGTGKSTELRRLRKRLEGSGYLVVLCDIEDYVLMTMPIDVSDFLLSLAGAVGDALAKEGLLEHDPKQEGYFERFRNYLTRTKVDFPEIGAAAQGATLKMTLKSDPSFKQTLQNRLAGHLGSFVADIRDYIQDIVRQLKERHGAEKELVVLIDSVEHIRGTSVNAKEVHSSVETLFAGHSDKLRLPSVHVVYTVPPFLKVLNPNLGSLYEPGGIQILPAVTLCDDSDGSPCDPGYDALRQAVEKRGDWKRLLGRQDALDRLVAMSGGHFRDLLRLVAEVLRRAVSLPVDQGTVDAAVNQIRNEFLPIADRDARWLAQIHDTHSASLEDVTRLPDFARFLDTHLVLCYHNGHEWYDTHPLVAGQVTDQVALLEKNGPEKRKPIQE
jgi:hypothetical protein